jgi:hypothetical protein
MSLRAYRLRLQSLDDAGLAAECRAAAAADWPPNRQAADRLRACLAELALRGREDLGAKAVKEVRAEQKAIREQPPTREETPVSQPQENLLAALAAVFDPKEVKWLPRMVQGNRALAMAYVDARTIQDRLDQVLGAAGWQDDYDVRDDGNVVCRLKLRIGSEWITKVDVGGPSEQPDGGDRLKAAFSDALKRAAVKFGVGRYLYRLPAQWADYDTKAKRFSKTPQLPAWALPGGKPAAQQPAAANGRQAQTPRLPERPPDADLDPAELIDDGLQKYLADLLVSRGYRVADFLTNKQLPTMGDATVEQYRKAVEWLLTKPAAKAG